MNTVSADVRNTEEYQLALFKTLYKVFSCKETDNFLESLAKMNHQQQIELIQERADSTKPSDNCRKAWALTGTFCATPSTEAHHLVKAIMGQFAQSYRFSFATKKPNAELVENQINTCLAQFDQPAEKRVAVAAA